MPGSSAAPREEIEARRAAKTNARSERQARLDAREPELEAREMTPLTGFKSLEGTRASVEALHAQMYAAGAEPENTEILPPISEQPVE